jgi:dolichyl-phosphate-mannose--protein O-mannosyl transferase
MEGEQNFRLRFPESEENMATIKRRPDSNNRWEVRYRDPDGMHLSAWAEELDGDAE